MLTFDDFEQAVARVPSAGGARHGIMLYSLVRWLKPAVVVEVGTYLGHTACWLAKGLQDAGEGGQLVCMDDFSLSGPDTLLRCAVNIGTCHVQEHVAFARGKSSEAPWPERVDLAFIDGDHSFEGCTGDFERAVAAGARCIVVHDIADWWGPRRWFCQLPGRLEWQVVGAGFEGGLAIAMRRPELGPERFCQREYPAGMVL